MVFMGFLPFFGNETVSGNEADSSYITADRRVNGPDARAGMKKRPETVTASGHFR